MIKQLLFAACLTSALATITSNEATDQFNEKLDGLVPEQTEVQTTTALHARADMDGVKTGSGAVLAGKAEGAADVDKKADDAEMVQWGRRRATSTRRRRANTRRRWLTRRRRSSTRRRRTTRRRRANTRRRRANTRRRRANTRRRRAWLSRRRRSSTRRRRRRSNPSSTMVNYLLGAGGYSKPRTGSKWIVASENAATRTMTITLRINAKRAGVGGNKPSSTNFAMMKTEFADAVNNYWRTELTINGAIWTVRTEVLYTSSKARNVKFKWQSGTNYKRSHNTDVTMTVWWNTWGASGTGGSTSLLNFGRVGAHEVGHSFLTKYKGTTYSWGHKGTSTVFGAKTKNTPSYSSVGGDFDLMKYYSGTRPGDYYSRVKAVQQDVLEEVLVGADKVYDM